MIPFTDRELRRAWRENLEASQNNNRSENPKSLLLFYATECGLKAVVLKNDGNSLTDESSIIKDAGHNLKELMRYLRIDGQFKLPRHLKLKSIQRKGRKQERGADIKDLNQVWRYGGELDVEINQEIEKKLTEINDWIKDSLL